MKPRMCVSVLYVILISATQQSQIGCQKRDPFYSQNEDLIRIMDAQDKIREKGSNKYVIHGAKGNLFYLEDLRAAVIKWNNLDSTVSEISEVSSVLKSKGIRFLIVPVPTKVETYSSILGGRNVYDISPSKNRFLHELDSLQVEYLDLRKDFFQAKSGIRLFPHTDTHWDEGAICLAAQKIAVKIPPQWKTHLDLPYTDSILIGFKGDLVDKFKLTETDRVHLKMVGNGYGGRFTEPDSASILLFGDSFLNQFKGLSAHLGAHLSHELGTSVKSIYSLVGFTKGPNKIKNIVDSYPGTKVVVWVFTSRSLMER